MRDIPSPAGTRASRSAASMWVVVTVVVIAALRAAPAVADYEVRGRFLYRDRPFALGGFTGVDNDQPIRFADVEIFDNQTLAVLAQTASDASGNFVVNVVDSQTRDLRVRVLSRANATPSLKLRVLRTTDSAVFAVASPVFTAHPPTAAVDFSANPVVAVQGAGGDAFNIWDQGVYAFDFIASRAGSRPGVLLTLYWATLSGNGTYYSHPNVSIYLLGLNSDSDAYDDTVILHEIGHYTEFNLAASHNPGGAHSLNGLYDLRLTWSEGQATFFNNLVRDWRGTARPDIYVDTSGQPGPGHAFISYEVETPSVGVPGANNEVTVNAVLWEIVDVPATADGSPGNDDDALQIATGVADFWDVFVQRIPLATSISLEDFWDGWFALGKDHDAAMRAAFGARGVEYFDDAFEPDDTAAQARTLVPDGVLEHHTIYGIGDEDWVKLLVAAGGSYVFQTQNMLSGADTRLDLYAADGTTLLASNDDRAPNDPSSRIAWTAPFTDLVHLRCKRKADAHTYGSYNLSIAGPTVAVAVSDVRVSPTRDGIELRWRAQTDAGFSHFDVERAREGAGPWERCNAEPLVPGSRTSEIVFLDAGALPDGRSFYRIVGIEPDGTRQFFGPYEAAAVLPARLALHGPWPNPFNPTTTIAFDVSEAGRATLRVHAADGRCVRTLLAGVPVGAGTHTVTWDGRDDAGRAAASGVYFVRLETATGRRSVRAVLLK